MCELQLHNIHTMTKWPNNAFLLIPIVKRYMTVYGKMCVDYMKILYAILYKDMNMHKFWYFQSILKPAPHGYLG